MPNLVTILGLCAGLTALRFAFAGRFEPAAALIIFAALIDGFDGLLARKLDAASPFGAELDSLADFFNFGVAPAFLVYQLALTGAPDLGWTAALIFAVCACLRLARFNVSRDVPVTGRAHFVGVPAPAGAHARRCCRPSSPSPGSPTPPRCPGWSRRGSPLVGLLMVCRLGPSRRRACAISRGSARWLLVGVALRRRADASRASGC